jgi:hypothetical protein
MSALLCHVGLHSWPRVHGFWREVVVAPAEAECRNCHKPLHSVWRSVYPEDGSKCPDGSCAVHPHA